MIRREAVRNALHINPTWRISYSPRIHTGTCNCQFNTYLTEWHPYGILLMKVYGKFVTGWKKSIWNLHDIPYMYLVNYIRMPFNWKFVHIWVLEVSWQIISKYFLKYICCHVKAIRWVTTKNVFHMHVSFLYIKFMLLIIPMIHWNPIYQDFLNEQND